MNAAKLRSLNASDAWLLLTTAAMLPAYAVAVRAGWYKPANWPLHVVRHEGSPVSRAQVLKVGALVNAAARYSFWRPSCLVRSLVLIAQLRRRSIPGNLCIGVQMIEGELKAHAWVEQHGLPVNDNADIARQFDPVDAVLGGVALGAP